MLSNVYTPILFFIPILFQLKPLVSGNSNQTKWELKAQPNESSDVCWWRTYEFQEQQVVQQQQNDKHRNFIHLADLQEATVEESKKNCMDTPLCNYISWDRWNKTARLYFVKFEYIMGLTYVYSSQKHSYSIECLCTGIVNKTKEKRPRRQVSVFVGWASQLNLQRRISDAWKTEENRAKFDGFAKRFNKTYATEEEAEHRRRVFQENLCRIDMFNWKSSMGESDTAEFGITAYSDLTNLEFNSGFTGLKKHKELPKPPDIQAQRVSTLFTQIKKDFSWRTCGVIPQVREQGPCGACYAFSVADLVASQYAIDHRLWNSTVNSLSPQAIIDCVPKPSAYGCEGGRPYGVLQYLANSTIPLPTETCYSYEMEQDKCRLKKCEKEVDNILVQWSESFNATGPREMEIIALLTNWGPSVTTIEVPDWMQFYKKGIMRSTQCGKTPEHAVLLVGYNNTSPTPHYIIKNSWGDDWGEEGYLRLEAGKNTCGVANYLVLTCTKNCYRLSHKQLMETSNANMCTLQQFSKRLRLQKICFYRLTYGD